MDTKFLQPFTSIRFRIAANNIGTVKLIVQCCIQRMYNVTVRWSPTSQHSISGVNLEVKIIDFIASLLALPIRCALAMIPRDMNKGFRRQISLLL